MINHHRNIVLVVLLILTARGAGEDNNSRLPVQIDACTPDVPVRAGLLTSPPSDINGVAGIIPLGNMDPGAGHVLAANHMYLKYTKPVGDGKEHVAVYNMAAGKLFSLFRFQEPGRPDYDYQISIKHTCSVYTYFGHIHQLSSRIDSYLASNGIVWQDVSGNGTGPWLVFLGQPDGPAMLSLAAGEIVGITKNYSWNWDIGLVDTRRISGIFANTSKYRYPSPHDLLNLFPIFKDIDLTIYNMGNETLNAACFIDYMDNSNGMRDAWHAKLVSEPRTCGRVGWDVPDHLRGAWFNPALESVLPAVNNNELAALSIVPDNYNPVTKIQIGFGNANSDASQNLAALDPSGWEPPIEAPQIRRAFRINIENNPFFKINPDPATIVPGVTVCYDLPYDDYFNSMLLRMSDNTHLKIKYDPIRYDRPRCPSLLKSTPVVDPSWIEYVR